MKNTLVLGASENPARYAFLAVLKLKRYGHPVIGLGLREGKIGEVPILTGRPELKDIHTITLYVGTKNQAPFYDYLLKLKPERIIFNPGTENPELEKMAREAGIETVEGCTLIMLSANTY